MKIPSPAWKILVVLLLSLPVALVAQDDPKPAQSAASQMSSPAAPAPGPKVTDPLENIKFRNLGPAVGGGRVTSVVGVPGRPNLYYAGAAAGGVFKTMDGGMSWKAIFEKQPNASIGAIAIAPSNPSLI